jgi:hypothetical protein
MFIATLMHHKYFAASDFVDATGKPTPLAEMRSADDRFTVMQAAAAAAAAAAAGVPASSVPLTLPDASPEDSAGGLNAPPTPAGVVTALRDVLPGDILVETAHHLRTGFGLKHKWDKRKREAEEAAASDAVFEAKMGEYGATGQFPRTRQSRFTGDGDAPPPSAAVEGGEGV